MFVSNNFGQFLEGNCPVEQVSWYEWDEFCERPGDGTGQHFKDCKNLTILTLQKTKFTAVKIEELKKALPMCKIEWDGM